MPGTPNARARKPMSLIEARKWACIGVLAAFAVVLGYVETFIPLPVPVAGVKLGLANIAILYALVKFGPKGAAHIALIKVLATGFLFGSPLMMLYSASGTALALAAMALLVRVSGLHVVFPAIGGAIFHNVGQLLVAMLVLGTPLVWYTLPILLVAACAMGALSGLLTRYLIAHTEEM